MLNRLLELSRGEGQSLKVKGIRIERNSIKKTFREMSNGKGIRMDGNSMKKIFWGDV